MDLENTNIAYFVVTALVIVWILYNRKSSKPTRLNLRAGGKGLPDLVRKNKRGQGEKSLDCIFMYNGHEFNAYEVLGVPAGASFKMVEASYNQLKEASGTKHDFYKAAYQAIKGSQ